MERLSRRAEDWMWNQSKRQTCLVDNNVERCWSSEECYDVSHEDAELEACTAVFLLLLFGFSISSLCPKPPFWDGNVYYAPFVCWNYIICCFILISPGTIIKIFCLESQKRLNFILLNSVETLVNYRKFWSWTECIFPIILWHKPMGVRE